MISVPDRNIFLYDTYEGMSEPTEEDVDLHVRKADSLLGKSQKTTAPGSVWAYATLDEVKQNMASTGYPESNIIYIKGKVEDTIPQNIPTGGISLLRLDTDWYASTLHVLKHLYP